jgi:predicted dehydrogenase
MPPLQLNRRRFLGCSAAAGIVIAQGKAVDGALTGRPVRLGLIGLGNRGTFLLRAALEMPGVEVVALADTEGKHLARAQGIVKKAKGQSPEAVDEWSRLLERTDVEAVAIALPCDLHAAAYSDALRAGKHLYAEKPLAPTLDESDRLIAEAARVPELVFHVGFQRRSSRRCREAVDLIRRGELGTLLDGRASWVSSNGPVSGHDGWLGQRARSGDWMVEQACHVWNLFQWIQGKAPVRAFGQGRRDLFAATQPARDVTDHYTVTLEWADGFHLAFVHSWVDPADDAFTGSWQRVVGTRGGLDLNTGVATFRERGQTRRTLGVGQGPDAATGLPEFVAAVRAGTPITPPLTLIEAREATRIGLLVRRAVDERRVVEMSEIDPGERS